MRWTRDELLAALGPGLATLPGAEELIAEVEIRHGRALDVEERAAVLWFHAVAGIATGGADGTDRE